MAMTGSVVTDVMSGKKFRYACDADESNFRFYPIGEYTYTPDKPPPWKPARGMNSWGDVYHQHGYRTHVCKSCGKRVYTGKWMQQIAEALESRSLCFECELWIDKIEKAQKGMEFLITSDYKCFKRGNEPNLETLKSRAARDSLGHAGAKFIFRKTDGSIVISHNVWFGGIVPEHLRDKLPTNCEILPEGNPGVPNKIHTHGSRA